MAWKIRAATKPVQESTVADYLIGEIEGMSASDQVEELADTLGRLLDVLPLSLEDMAKILKVDPARISKLS